LTRPDPSQAESSPFTPRARGDGEPAFDEAWQAQVLALAFALTQTGVFSPSLWSDTLGAELRAANDRGEPDNLATYYACALKALEHLVANAGAITDAALAERIEAWRQAYLNTPHGQPVHLSAADQSPST
jgi:nitrile hydratase accessory protein